MTNEKLTMMNENLILNQLTRFSFPVTLSPIRLPLCPLPLFPYALLALSGFRRKRIPCDVRKLISTSASWTPVPLRLALAVVFICSRRSKVWAVLVARDSPNLRVPRPLFLSCVRVVVDGGRGVR